MCYFLLVLRGEFLEGLLFHLLVPQFWPIALIGLTAFSIAGWLYRHRMY